MLPMNMAGERPLSFAVRSQGIEVGIVGAEIAVRRTGWPAQMLRQSCPTWLQGVLMVQEQRLPLAIATAHYSGGVLRIYKLGQLWLVLEGVDDKGLLGN